LYSEAHLLVASSLCQLTMRDIQDCYKWEFGDFKDKLP